MLRKLGQNIKLQSVFILLREWKAIWALKAATAPRKMNEFRVWWPRGGHKRAETCLIESTKPNNKHLLNSASGDSTVGDPKPHPILLKAHKWIDDLC